MTPWFRRERDPQISPASNKPWPELDEQTKQRIRDQAMAAVLLVAESETLRRETRRPASSGPVAEYLEELNEIAGDLSRAAMQFGAAVEELRQQPSEEALARTDVLHKRKSEVFDELSEWVERAGQFLDTHDDPDLRSSMIRVLDMANHLRIKRQDVSGAPDAPPVRDP